MASDRWERGNLFGRKLRLPRRYAARNDILFSACALGHFLDLWIQPLKKATTIATTMEPAAMENVKAIP